jgi:flagellar assembly protein FliH
MDAIIRAAAVSNVAFELRRRGERAAAAPARAGAAPLAAASAAPPPAPSATAAPAGVERAPAKEAPASVAPPATVAAPAAPAATSVPPAAVPTTAPAAPAARAQQAPVPTAVTAAQQEAERRKVQAELAELRAEAERRGYAVGQEKGEADARRLLQAQIDRFQGLAAQLAQARAAVLADAEDGVVELAFAALCRILGEQAASRDGVHAMVARCAADVREREQVGIRLHPDDVALLGDVAGHHARFSADPGIVLGGCIVDSSTGALDARLEIQLARLAETLLAVRAARRGGEGA